MSAPARTSLTRTIATPVTVVLFLVATVSGIMMFFHFQSGLVKETHEWLGLAFVGFGIWHMVRNWQGFLGYFRRNLALVAFAAPLVVAGAMVAATGRVDSGGGGPRAVFKTLEKAPIEKVAPAFGLSAEQALKRLRAAGYKAETGQSLHTISEQSGMHGPGALMLLAKKTD
jgi:hypothetical protein